MPGAHGADLNRLVEIRRKFRGRISVRPRDSLVGDVPLQIAPGRVELFTELDFVRYVDRHFLQGRPARTAVAEIVGIGIRLICQYPPTPAANDPHIHDSLQTDNASLMIDRQRIA
jgi:hypothetical protein